MIGAEERVAMITRVEKRLLRSTYIHRRGGPGHGNLYRNYASAQEKKTSSPYLPGLGDLPATPQVGAAPLLYPFCLVHVGDTAVECGRRGDGKL